jgi:primosomal protein N'
MELVTVAPISKGVLKENLSYFSKDKLSCGSVVEVLIRKRRVLALVVSSEPIADVKSAVKKAGFLLKRITGNSRKFFFRPDFIEAAREIADYFFSSQGAVIKEMVPQAVLSAPASCVFVSETAPSVSAKK